MCGIQGFEIIASPHHGHVRAVLRAMHRLNFAKLIAARPCAQRERVVAEVIVALLDRDERFHSQCVQVISDVIGQLATCEAVIAEACYLLRRTYGAPEAVIKNVANGVFQTPGRLVDQATSIEKLLKKYHDVPMDLADAGLVDLADKLDTGRILTLDRDFEVYRWRSRRKFELLVDL